VSAENLVCSLELSKRLKELGVKQKSVFYFIDHFEDHKIVPVITNYDREIFNLLIHDVFPPTLYAAFTVSELNEIIFEKNYDSLEKTGYLNITTEMIDRSGGYFYRITNNFRENIIDDLSLANALAMLLIYLMECDLL